MYPLIFFKGNNMTTTTTTAKATVVETDSYEGRYGFHITRAIVAHPEHGRIYMTSRYGGERSLNGGMVRWRHGMVVKMRADDELRNFQGRSDDLWSLERGEYRDRPILDWTGAAIESLAKSLGI